jgi:hypothetical protein
VPIPGLSLVGLLPQALGIEYLKTVCSQPDPAKCRSEWQVARARYGQRSAPLAPDVQSLPPGCSSHLAAVRSHKRFARTYQGVKVDFALVEIEGLLAYQANVAFKTPKLAISPAIPGKSIPQDLLDLCLPTRLPAVEPKWSRTGDENVGAISFYCGDDFEFRILAGGLWPPDIQSATQGVGIEVGMGFGLVYVMRSAGQCYLVNGYHRTINLMLAGHTWVPCLIADVDPTFNPALVYGGPVGRALNQASPPATCADYRRADPTKLRKQHRVINVSWSQTLVPDE